MSVSQTQANMAKNVQSKGTKDTAEPKRSGARAGAKTGGLKIPRRFTREGVNPMDQVRWEKRSTRITNPDGSVVFEMTDCEIPAFWSQLATDIMVSKYFRKAGVPQKDAAGTPIVDESGKPVLGPERSARQVISRLTSCWRWWGEEYGYFDTEADAQAFEDELNHMLVHQMAAPNSPQWFNTGLFHAYGVNGPAQGHYYVDPDTAKLTRAKDSYSHPQPHACFIQAVRDDLVNEGGIMDLWAREARLFKYGSGTGTNFSDLRGDGEPLSGGGRSSGLMSFLKIGDRAAGAIKSGGTTRRAAKMVCLDLDHPDIEAFVNWKVEEERKVAALVKAGYSSDFNGDAYATVSGQNSNNSVRVPDDFIKAVKEDSDWHLYGRVELRDSREEGRAPKPHRTLKARKLWEEIAYAAWKCADPGVQYDTVINDWHTCPEGGRIRASNPCVTGDTLVATGEGWRRIDSLLERSFDAVGADGRTHAVKPAFTTGVKPVYRLRTRAGFEVKLTADHRVLTLNRGDVPACELTKDDVLQLRAAPFGKRALDQRLATFLGLATGDGCLMGAQETAMLTLSPEEDALARRVHADLTSFKAQFAADGRAARDVEVHQPQGTLRIGTSARCVVDPLKELAVLGEGSGAKRFTPAVFDLDRPSVAAVLRGLFTADGTVANYGEKSQYVALDSVSLDLLSQVQLLLLGFGIKSKLYRDRRVTGQTMALLPDGKGGRKEYPVDQIHSLRISRSSRLLFEQLVGFMPESAKADKLAELNRSVAAYADRLEDRVESIEFAGEERVYDLTEPETHHFVAAGLTVHNCSEYMFLDDTACNLASLNFSTFFERETGKFDVEAIRHATRLWTVVLEISVLMAQYPSKEIAQRSYEYRTLGLGYANLGSCLMMAGIPYDSREAMATCGALTAVMTGESYAASAEMAQVLGAFPKYIDNAPHMLRVIRNHRRAAYNAPASEYESLGVAPVGIDPEFCPQELLDAARGAWDRALDLGRKYGFRNAQTTVIAPTGTIGLLMDCDTTGIEPDFALVKFKKLAGGGYFKIVNQSVSPALSYLGYNEAQCKAMIDYIVGTNRLEGAPYVNTQTLKSKNFTDADIARIEAALPGVFELSWAFTPWVLGNEAMERLGFKPEQYNDSTFNLLRALGFTAAQIEEAGEIICGRQTIEGAPELKPEHLPIFDCANRCGKHGKRFIHHMGHVNMMAAAQPFVSGAISKTINMPNEVNIDDIKDAYMRSWELGLKAVALYRDGSKLSQVLSSGNEKKEEEADTKEGDDSASGTAKVEAKASQELRAFTPEELYLLHPKLRRRPLPKRRRGITYEAKIGGQKVYLRTGEYDDGTLGEMFIDMNKEGATMRSIMNCLAIAVSKGLQYGVPLEEFVDTFTFTRFEPHGVVEGHPNVKFATSVVDFVFRVLGYEYMGRTDFLQVKPEELLERAPASSDHETKKITEVLREQIVARAKEQSAKSSTPGCAGAARGGASSLKPQASSPKPASSHHDALDGQLEGMMGDAPMCDVCGHVTVRNGACYKCLNCGNSMGCS